MKPLKPEPPWAAVLLAGGRSTRMGADKALLPWGGVPLWLVQARKLAALSPDKLFISCRQEQKLPQTPPGDFAVEWLFDPPGQGEGPMLPVLQTLKKAATQVLVLAVDLPEMSIAFLTEVVRERPETAFFFRSSHGVEPLAGIYTQAMIPLMERAVDERRYSLRRLIEEAEGLGLALIRTLTPADEMLFLNANTPGEWRKATG